MLDERRTHLLMVAGKALDRGEIPLGEAFIRDNDVSMSEAHDLAEDMETAIDLYLAMRERMQRRLTNT